MVNSSNGRTITLFLMGSGGDGVVTAGDLLAREAAHCGLPCHMTKTFGPQIRGGESGVWLQLGGQAVRGPVHAVEVLFVLSWKSAARFASMLNLAEGALVFQDAAEEAEPPIELVDVAGNVLTPISLPLADIVKNELDAPRSRNLLSAGFLAGFLGLRGEVIPTILQRKFARKGADLVEKSIAVFDRGKALSQEERFDALRRSLLDGERKPRLLLTGNDAVVLGALHSGVQYFAGYPITPATEILVGLGVHLPGAGGVMIQAEDEIAALCMVIGASFGGRKSMTATSGPGLSLMTEALGLACQMELPCVIVNVQRGGPSTGMPTKTEQSDLQLAVYGAHGDAPRVVLAAEDVKTCFDVTVKAFYLSEKYQTPVIVLTDQLIGHRSESLPEDVFSEGNAFRSVARRLVPTGKEEGPYERYKLGEHPVSPIAIPGMKGFCYRTSGIVHNEDGSPTASSAVHEKMNEKVRRKMGLILGELPGVRREGPEDAPVGVITWGSTAGVVCEAAARRTEKGKPTAVLVVEMLCPLPVVAITDFLRGLEKVAVAELTFSGQFLRLLRANGIPLEQVAGINRGGGDPFTTQEVAGRFEELWG